MTFAYVGLGTAFLLIVWAVYTYNSLVHARNKVAEAYSGIDVQLKMRHDLVPNLVQVVRGYADHEHRVLDSVATLRNQAMALEDPAALQRVENKLAQEMRGVIGLAERYPNLKASQEFQKLMTEVTDVENEIQASRSLYNANVQFYNSRAQSLPTNLIANHMTPRDFPFLSFDYVEADASKLLAGEFAA
ncbi:MAG: LemA family protein [Solirubrobacterales bacterium]